MIKSFKAQVMRVLNKMVQNGEVTAKLSENGEVLYSLTNKAKQPHKHKPAKTRSSAALKAWETRRKLAKAKTTKLTKTTTRSSAALKAWETRRKNTKLTVMRKEAAKKAWDTRKKNASNPLLRGKFLK